MSSDKEDLQQFREQQIIKDKEELQSFRTEKKISDCLVNERKISDSSYARKIVELIVFAMVGIILTAFLYQIINLIIKTHE